MDNDMLMFAAIFLISVIVICAGVVAVALNRVGHTSKRRPQRRKIGYAQRVFKDVM